VAMFWVCVLAVSILFYVLLDGFDLGVGILFGFTLNGARCWPLSRRYGTATRPGSSSLASCFGGPFRRPGCGAGGSPLLSRHGIYRGQKADR
jgi:hypothetical protein